MIGLILRTVKGKSFGFISADNRDYFFHADDFIGNWYEMESEVSNGNPVKVFFEDSKTDKGLRARNVRLV